jgi:uncharacterized protein
LSLYLDSSAMLGVLLDEPTGLATSALLAADPDWFSARHTAVEVRRNLARLLSGADHEEALDAFNADWKRTNIIELDAETCERAAELAESSGVRTLDALHLAAAIRVGGTQITLVTCDRRLALAARSLGIPVSGD